MNTILKWYLIDLLKTLQITKNLKIIGASMGGSTALKLSFEIPDSIDKIGLLSPAGLFGEPKRYPFNQIGPHF